MRIIEIADDIEPDIFPRGADVCIRGLILASPLGGERTPAFCRLLLAASSFHVSVRSPVSVTSYI